MHKLSGFVVITKFIYPKWRDQVVICIINQNEEVSGSIPI